MTTPKLCVTLTAPTMAELRAARDRAVDADLVEMRLDTTSDPDPAGALEGRRCPVIITCRPSWEGGQFAGSEDERKQILRRALDLGAEFVDVEFHAHFDDVIAADGGRRIVISSHDFVGMPADLAARARAMRATGAQVVKIAGKASCLRSCLPLLDLARRHRGEPMVLIAMGDAGAATRVLAGRFGSAWTYAGQGRSIGQLAAEVLLGMYRFRGISARTAIFGLTGSPIGHSVSPAMHNAACAATGIDAVYLPLPASDADDFLAFAEAIGLAGASVTIPYKVALFERADEVDQTARDIGAINTLKRDGARWLGRNTDLAGFLNPLEAHGVALAGKRVSILGAGGAARSVACGAASRGARVTVHARRADRARPIAELARGAAGSWPPAADAWDVLVNCTPIGMHPHEGVSPLSLADFPEQASGLRPQASAASGPEPGARSPKPLVYDLVYNPVETELLRRAHAAGCDTIGGLDMLVEQAIEQFAWWTGVRPDAAPMRAAAMAALSEFTER